MYQRMYDFSVDIWAVGAMFAGIIFQKECMFDGMNNLDTVVKIANVRHIYILIGGNIV